MRGTTDYRTPGDIQPPTCIPPAEASERAVLLELRRRTTGPDGKFYRDLEGMLKRRHLEIDHLRRTVANRDDQLTRQEQEHSRRLAALGD